MVDRIVRDPSPPGSILLDGLTAVLSEQRGRMARLQALVDVDGEAFARQVSFPSCAEAMKASYDYDSRWFRELPYSQRVKVLIARSLVDAASIYPIVDVSYWSKVVESTQ